MEPAIRPKRDSEAWDASPRVARALGILRPLSPALTAGLDPMPTTSAAPSASHAVSFREALHVWTRIGLLSFGGPAGQIALMHRVLVEEKRWISEERFLHALNYCMLLPGPEAMQLATYVGWLLHGTRGGLVAGMLFVLPERWRSSRSRCSTRPARTWPRSRPSSSG
jgi:hypothetical protein